MGTPCQAVPPAFLLGLPSVSSWITRLGAHNLGVLGLQMAHLHTSSLDRRPLSVASRSPGVLSGFPGWGAQPEGRGSAWPPSTPKPGSSPASSLRQLRLPPAGGTERRDPALALSPRAFQSSGSEMGLTAGGARCPLGLPSAPGPRDRGQQRPPPACQGAGLRAGQRRATQ